MRWERHGSRAFSCSGAIGRAGGAALLLLGLAAAVASCRATPADATAPAPDSRRTVDAVVSRGRFVPRLLLTGELQAVRSEKIVVPRTPAWRVPIRWMEADGAEVVVGQKVLELDNSQFAGDLEQNRLAESKALNDLMRKDADIAVDLADKRLARERARVGLAKARLAADVPPELIMRREYQELQLALARAEVEWEKADEELRASERAAEAELEELRIALEQARDKVAIAEQAIAALTVRAPSDGILVVSENRWEDRKFQIGDTVWPGLSVMSIPDLTMMKVEAMLSDVDDGKIATGMEAVCVLDTYPDREFLGRVAAVAPIAQEQRRDSQRRAFRVEVALEEVDAARMRPGMSVRVEVLGQPVDDALLVPRAAIDFAAEVPRALLEDGAVVEVELGPCDARTCVVERGLTAGQRLGRRG